ncbi:MAG: hypothetical protein AABM66_11115 [Actinomycetota bacterium]
MRKSLNENPIAQIAVLGVLAVVVGFLLLTRAAGKSGGDASSSSTTASSATATPAPAIDSAGSTTPDPSTGSGEAPSTSDAQVGEFVAGPGLPRPVVKAYRDDKTIVLLVLRRRGIDDERLRQQVERLGGKGDLALFVTNAGHIARYSRITQGVNVDRVPALIVLQPRHLTKGMPKATLSYGFRGPQSVDQAIRDALYKGPTNLPYHPR